MKRVGQIEFRWSEGNNKHELVQWRFSEKEYCFVIAFFDRTKEGYDMRTVGSRYLDALLEWHDDVLILTEYAFSFLMAEHRLYTKAIEANTTVVTTNENT